MYGIFKNYVEYYYHLEYCYHVDYYYQVSINFYTSPLTYINMAIRYFKSCLNRY